MKLLAPKWSNRTMNPEMMIKNQQKVLDREKHDRNRDNRGSIQDHMMMGSSKVVGSHHHLYDVARFVHSIARVCGQSIRSGYAIAGDYARRAKPENLPLSSL